MIDPVPGPKYRSRRDALRLGGAGMISLFAAPVMASTANYATGQRSLSFHHRHTGESMAATYWENGEYIPQALDEIDVLLRDFWTDETIRIDVGLLDSLYLLHDTLATTEPLQVICGYRSPSTNAAMARQSRRRR